MDETLPDNNSAEHTPPAPDSVSSDLTDIELALISMGFVPVPDEFGNTNWVNPNRLIGGEAFTDTE